MSKGANSQAGFNAQNWAALSLFVQYSAYQSFQRIELEKPKLADFVLVFSDKRIICESKKSHITYAGLRNILDTLPEVNEQDKILIICTSIGPRIKEDLDNAKYYPGVNERLVKKHQFTIRHLELIPKVKFWVVDKGMNEEIVRNLVGERFGSWLPDDELSDLVSTLLVKNIYDKSATGGVYTKAEFTRELERRKVLLKKKDDYKYSERTAKDIINKILDELKNAGNSRLQSDNRLKAVIADSSLHYFAIQEISKKDNLDLCAWNNFWLATFSTYYVGEVLSIFEDNIRDKDSARYIVGFIKDNIQKLRFRNMKEYEFKSIADILMKAIDVSDEFNFVVFDILKRIYSFIVENPLFVEDGSQARDNWLLSELAIGFGKLYSKADESLGSDIIAYIYTTFDILSEEGEYPRNTPQQLFEILKDDLLAKPSNFEDLFEQLTSQYRRRYREFKVKYDGWEVVGGSVSNFNGEYEVHDKVFIGVIIIPYINSLSVDRKWELADKYLTPKVSKVSEYRPDFMNRAFIPFLIEQYEQGSKKAFRILSDFIKMRRGIPHKAELIFYYTRNSRTLNYEQKWDLMNVAINEFGYPINIFMDQVLWELLRAQHRQAIELFSNLMANKNYMNRQIMFDTTVLQSIMCLISNGATFLEGVRLLERFLQGEYFSKSLDSFHSYDAKAPIIYVLEKDYGRGVKIIRSLIANKPTENQQRVFGTVLRDIPDQYLEQIYSDIVKHELDTIGDAIKLAAKITNTEARENFVWFAEKLSRNHKFEEAFYIADFFISDPSPEKDNEFDKDIIEGKHSIQISTVRGCLGWMLSHVNSYEGRDYIRHAFELTKRLCMDNSLYVRQLSLLTLEGLMNNRHSTMPESEEWFMDYSIVKDIEDFAFRMVKDKTNYHYGILRHLARVFSRIRTMNESQALEVINIFREHGDYETLKELDTLIIFLAEFREDAFKNWPESRGIMLPYNPKHVQKQLEDFLENGSEEHKASLVWHITKLPEEPIRNNSNFDKFFDISMKYLPYAIKKYNHHAYRHIYMFIERYIDKKFDDCYKIWRMCIDVERPLMIAKSEKGDHPNEYNWWPYYHNGSILVKVMQHCGVKHFLSDLEFLIDYPREAIIAQDFKKVFIELEKITNHDKEVTRIYEKLQSRDFSHYHSYEKWISK